MAKRDDGFGYLFLGLVAFGGIAIAADQHTKRKEEEERFQQALTRLNARLVQQEAELARLQGLLGPKNEQVRALAQEVEHLRQLIATRRVA